MYLKIILDVTAAAEVIIRDIFIFFSELWRICFREKRFLYFFLNKIINEINQ